MTRTLSTGSSAAFQIGDTVILKSGGPDMTVVAIVGSAKDRITCNWFAGKKMESGTFPMDAVNTKQAASSGTENPDN